MKGKTTKTKSTKTKMNIVILIYLCFVLLCALVCIAGAIAKHENILIGLLWMIPTLVLSAIYFFFIDGKVWKMLFRLGRTSKKVSWLIYVAVLMYVLGVAGIFFVIALLNKQTFFAASIWFLQLLIWMIAIIYNVMKGAKV